MPPASDLLLYAGAALLMVLTPGPTMVYLVSRSICQGRRAGVVSALGVASGLCVHMLAAAAGLSVLFVAVPLAYELLRWAGALYLLWLAWQAVRPGARSPLSPRALPPDSMPRLFAMGLLTNLLNPKLAVFFLSVFPQFVVPDAGAVFLQSLSFGLVQVGISLSVNTAIVLSAAGIASWFARRPLWLVAQRWLMGGVLAGMALKLALEPRRG